LLAFFEEAKIEYITIIKSLFLAQSVLRKKLQSLSNIYKERKQ